MLQLEMNPGCLCAFPRLVGGRWEGVETFSCPSFFPCAVSASSAGSVEGLQGMAGVLSPFHFALLICSFVPVPAVLQRMSFTPTMRATRWCVRMWSSKPSSKTFTFMG